MLIKVVDLSADSPKIRPSIKMPDPLTRFKMALNKNQKEHAKNKCLIVEIGPMS